ncbi:putative gmp synthase protein [Rosellinia necatrix]|uniref:Putative gmp synthase protein n=1 Tax=Rosellinia necatrix TaxID=77044 RepID=A0A1S7UK50_ROSNE|nr:putative gmp synthase protein [Rosellinia necatrix]
MGSRGPNGPIRLAILEADIPVAGIQAKYQSYGGVFAHLFKRACASFPQPVSLESQLTLSSHEVVNDMTAYPNPDTIDAILITGSKHNAFDNDEWIVRLVNFTKLCIEGGRIRVIGVCFGHQIIGRALGAQLGKNPRGWEVSVTEHELTDEGKKIFGLEKMSIHQMHRDAVLSFPPGALQLARTDVCNNQAMYVPGRFISVQGHPEFTEEMVREILDIRRSSGGVTNEIYQDGIDRVANKHDGVSIAQAFLRFLHR